MKFRDCEMYLFEFDLAGCTGDDCFWLLTWNIRSILAADKG